MLANTGAVEKLSVQSEQKQVLYYNITDNVGTEKSFEELNAALAPIGVWDCRSSLIQLFDKGSVRE